MPGNGHWRHRLPDSFAAFADPFEHFIAGDAVDFWVHEAVDYVLGDRLPASGWRIEFGYDSPAQGDGKTLALSYFAQEFGKFGFGFEGADFVGIGHLSLRVDSINWFVNWLIERIRCCFDCEIRS